MIVLHLPLFPGILNYNVQSYKSDIINAYMYLQSETEAKCFAHLSLHLPESD